MSNPTVKFIITMSWRGAREILCFEITGPKTLTLLPGTFESRSEFMTLYPGRYLFVTFEEWLEKLAG